jgi:NADH-quinone oxidoreductase subunit N
MERQLGQGVHLDDYKGLAKTHPWMALAMAFFMLSLIGIPLTGGFAAKFYVLRTALEANLFWLAIIAIITSVVSAFYYLRVVYLMYMYDGEAELVKRPALLTAVWIAAIVTLLLGILPAWGYDFARNAVIESVQLLAAGG